MNSLIGNTRDLRYMQFPSATAERTKFLNQQMNGITGSSFIEVYRKNNDLNRNVVSIREKRDAVKEILIYNNNNLERFISFILTGTSIRPKSDKWRRTRSFRNWEKILLGNIK